VVGKSFSVDFGLIATKQLRNNGLSATARDCAANDQRTSKTALGASYLIITCDELGHGMEDTIAREALWARYLPECAVQRPLLLPFAPSFGVLCLVLHRFPILSGHCPMIDLNTRLLASRFIKLVVLPNMLPTRRVPALQEGFFLPMLLDKFLVLPFCRE
jgi:hypothetical protein